MKIKFTYVTIIILFFTGLVFARKDANFESTKYYVWIPSAIGGLNISQIALSN